MGASFRVEEGKLILTFEYQADVDKAQSILENAALNIYNGLFSDFQLEKPFDEYSNQEKVNLIYNHTRTVIKHLADSVIDEEEDEEARTRAEERKANFDD